MNFEKNDRDEARLAQASAGLFAEQHQAVCRKTDRMFAGLLAFEFVLGVAFAWWVSPRTWIGRTSSVHPHVWAALGLGFLISIFPIYLAWTRPGRVLTRHTLAVGQMLWSALFIHLTGGRIETHFHVFGSLAFLAFYWEWPLLLTATVVVAGDHFLRGVFWPQSVYGILAPDQWRWLEHSAWVIFEDVVLFIACRIALSQARELSRRRAESDLLSERRLETLKEYEALVNTVEGVVWEADAASMTFSFVSKQSEKMLGVPALAWTHAPDFWKSLIHPEDRERVSAEFSRRDREEEFFELEYRLLSFGGQTITVRNAVSVIREAAKPVLYRGILTDITERRRLESMKNDFISNVSHELRTPLTSIRGSLGLVASGVTGALPPKAKGMLDLACKNTERLVRLVNDILDIQRIESGKMQLAIQPSDVTALVGQAVENHRGFAESCGVKVQMTAGLPGAFARLDADRMTQVLTNLLSNASKFSAQGQTVSVSITRREQSVRISVSDRGAGIPEAFKARIFQKFAQAETADTRLVQGKGTGLGLNISKALMEAMGGTIGFESELGRGSTFYVELPEEIRLAASPAPPSEGKRARILVCDDEADICAVLQAMLEKEGYDADIALSAKEARECLSREHYDGMTLDLSMPEKDGLTFIRELRQESRTRDLPIVVVSAFSDDGQHILSGEAVGVVDWLAKPIDVRKLRDALANGLKQIGGETPRILHVEDDPEIRELVSSALEGQAVLVGADTLQSAMGLVKSGAFDLVIMDLLLPDGSGLDLLPVLRQSARPSTPVLVFSGQEISPLAARHVSGVLGRSTTSNEKLASSIKGFLGKNRNSERTAIRKMTEIRLQASGRQDR